MAPYEALYRRPSRSSICWAYPEDSLLLRPELVRQTIKKIDMIRERILVVQSHQKSYGDLRRRPLEFHIRDYVLLNVSPMKGVQQFDMWGKLALRYIGSFKIIECIGAISYRLEIPTSMLSIHDVFYVSMLKKHLRDEEQQRVLDAPEIELNDDLTTIEVPVCILAKEDKKLRKKVIPLVKVQ
ncbi:uncharacterized protein LOC109847666 [Asparagus officinalis]|uniref:uncharacterized protein LOC109847666 n=1 Tax=Asparagus officinalis TaxID=4686 RepID=UPI00098E4F22|nr:uncharacterized protein LOC109847666 [Asparagus officinalis]